MGLAGSNCLAGFSEKRGGLFSQLLQEKKVEGSACLEPGPSFSEKRAFENKPHKPRACGSRERSDVGGKHHVSLAKLWVCGRLRLPHGKRLGQKARGGGRSHLAALDESMGLGSKRQWLPTAQESEKPDVTCLLLKEPSTTLETKGLNLNLIQPPCAEVERTEGRAEVHGECAATGAQMGHSTCQISRVPQQMSCKGKEQEGISRRLKET